MGVSGKQAIIGAVLMAAMATPALAQDVRVLGRADVRGDGSFGVQWSGSGFEARFTGSEFFAQIDDWGHNIYRIEVDGMEATLDLQPGLRTYQLFDGADGEHTIRVTRRTSSGAGPTYFEYIRADGKVKPTKAPERRMMVIGDANVTGFGVLGEDERCSFSWETQDHGQSFGALTAEYFGADLHTIAVDGAGLTRNYADKHSDTLAEVLDVTLPSVQRGWRSSKYVPDAIVISLGVADFWNGDPGEGFDEAYVDMLAKLRRDYPEALVLVTVGPQLNGDTRTALVGSVQGAVSKRVAGGDEKVEFIELPLAEGGRRLGCDWHPGVDSQLGMANTLALKLKELLGWEQKPDLDAMLMSNVTVGR